MLEMLDAIEARISALRTPATVEDSARDRNENAAVVLQAELRAVGLSAGEFAKLACVPPDALNGCIDADGVSRQWILAAIRMIALLTPSARRKLLQAPAAVPARTNSHPFSRIEDL
jgi:hypothetical protein